MGYGYIERDYNGTVVAAACHSVMFFTEPIIVETLATLRAVEFCINRGFFHNFWEGDSLIVITALNKRDENWRRHGQIMHDIDMVLNYFQSWRCCYTKRWTNKAAHRLAKEGVLHGVDRVLFNFILVFLAIVVNSEKSSSAF
jgi:hypothetical protein